MTQQIPRSGEFYRHFKNKIYQILTIAEHSETGEAMVIYQAMYGTFKVYARPLELFMGKVDKAKYPMVVQEYRFEKIAPEDLGEKAEREKRRSRSHPIYIEERGSKEMGKTVPVTEDGRPIRRIRSAGASASKKEASRQAERERGIYRGEEAVRHVARQAMLEEAEEKRAVRSTASLFRAGEEEKRKRLSVWKKLQEQNADADAHAHTSMIRAQATQQKEDALLDDYAEAELLANQEKVVIPRTGRSEKAEEEMWESLTQEAVSAEDREDGNSGEDAVSPRFIDFLEAHTFEAKAAILESMEEEVDDAMIDGLAMAVDVEIPGGPVEERFHQLKQCLETMAKYEDHRLR